MIPIKPIVIVLGQLIETIAEFFMVWGFFQFSVLGVIVCLVCFGIWMLFEH